MTKRITVSFSIFLMLLFGMLMKVYSVSMGMGLGLAQAASNQSTYTLKVASSRATIYDCNLHPMIPSQKEYIAAVSPTKEAAAALTNVLSQEEMNQIYPLLTEGKPFIVKVPNGDIEAEGLEIFEVERQEEDSTLAIHVMGYLDGSGEGVSGMEKVYHDFLEENRGEISIRYKVDAVNRVLAGEDYEITDTYDRKNSGVVLTIDKEIQAKVEELMEQYIEKGAVVVVEVPTGKIRAMASMPTFSPSNITEDLKSEDSPFLNRALSAYNVGSVFKLVTAAVALEEGIPEQREFDCTGGYAVSGDIFHCYNGEAHGLVDMQEAIARSCNTYFIDLMQEISGEKLLSMARRFGFGERIRLAPGYFCEEGTLPEESELKIPKALANFSFGQGSLLATPVQIAAMIHAIASGGEYRELSLVEGIVDSDLTFIEKEETESYRVISEQIAGQLKRFMAASVDHGTSQKGKPLIGGAGAKTGTAQTGIIVEDREIVQSWYAGFYPYNNPQYVIVVLGEDGEGGGSTCAPVFKELTDWFALGE